MAQRYTSAVTTAKCFFEETAMNSRTKQIRAIGKHLVMQVISMGLLID